MAIMVKRTMPLCVAALILSGSPVAWAAAEVPAEAEPDAVSLLQQNVNLVTTKSVILQKQYVPVMNPTGEKIVAYKTAYFGEVQVGTPAKPFSAVFDTGSGHVILPRDTCPSEACLKHRRYDNKESTSASLIKHDGTLLTGNEKERDQVVVSFGTGKVTGEFAEDRICIGDSTSDCPTMRLVLAVEMSEDPFSQFAFDGVVGLALDAIRLNPQFSFFGEMTSQTAGMLPQFSVFLSRQDDGESKITFGGHDKELTTSELQWAPVVQPEHGHWTVQIKQIRIGSAVLEECTDGTCKAVLDTGTSLLGVPRDITRSMHRMLARPVPSDHGDPNDIDCRNVPGDSIEFDLGDMVVSLPVEVYSRPAPINMTTNNSGQPPFSTLLCRSLLLPVDMKAPVGPKLFIFGEPFLRRYLTVYDFDKQRIGFSLARQPLQPKLGKPSIGRPPEGSTLIGAPLPDAVKAPAAPLPDTVTV